MLELSSKAGRHLDRLAECDSSQRYQAVFNAKTDTLAGRISLYEAYIIAERTQEDTSIEVRESGSQLETLASDIAIGKIPTGPV